MALNFPPNPVLDQVHEENSRSWTFNGKGWVGNSAFQIEFATSAETNAGVISNKAVQPAGGAYAYDRLRHAGQHEAGKGTAIVTLVPDTGVVTIDGNLSNVFEITLTENVTFATPINLKNGQTYNVLITQDGTGGRTATFSSAWTFTNRIDPVLSTAANAVDMLSCQWQPSSGKARATLLPDFGAGYTPPPTPGFEDFDHINVGGGSGVFRDVVGTDINLRTIVGGGGIDVTTSGDTIVVSYTAPATLDLAEVPFTIFGTAGDYPALPNARGLQAGSGIAFDTTAAGLLTISTNLYGVPIGGTTGQILMKVSDTDGDADWVDSTGGGANALADLSDVDLTGLADGDALVYDSATLTWIPGAGGGGGPTASIIDASRTLYVYEDFLTKIPVTASVADAWSVFTSSGTVNYTSEAGAPGIISLETDTSGSGQAGVIRQLDAATTASSGFVVGGGEITYRARVRFRGSLPTAASNGFLRAGLVNEISGAPSEGIYFATDAVGGGGVGSDGRFMGATRGTLTYWTSGTTVVPVLNQWYDLRFVVNAAGTSVDFFVDDALIGTASSNIPTGPIVPSCQIQKSTGASEIIVDCDFIEVVQNLTTARGSAIVVAPFAFDIATDTIWDALGDIVVGTGEDTASRLPAGIDGQVLTANSLALRGVEWADPTGGSGVPAGGAAGQVLTKVSATDGDADWQDPTGGGGAAGAWQFVGEVSITGSAATSLTISQLDLNVDEMYKIEVIADNALGSTNVVKLEFNGDSTAANYYRQRVNSDGATIDSSRINNNIMVTLDAGEPIQISLTLQKSFDGLVRGEYSFLSGSTTTAQMMHGWILHTGTNLTSFAIVGESANGLSVGTRIRVWKVSARNTSGELPGSVTVFQESDMSIVSQTTLQDTDLVTPVLQPGTYLVKFGIYFTSHLTPDMKLRMDFTGTASSAIGSYLRIRGTVESSAEAITALPYNVTAVTTDSTRWEGALTLVVTGEGRLKFQAAQDTSSVTAVTFHSGSYFSVVPLGAGTAALVPYDNAVSGMVATNTQAAVDELSALAGRYDQRNSVEVWSDFLVTLTTDELLAWTSGGTTASVQGVTGAPGILRLTKTTSNGQANGGSRHEVAEWGAGPITYEVRFRLSALPPNNSTANAFLMALGLTTETTGQSGSSCEAYLYGTTGVDGTRLYLRNRDGTTASSSSYLSSSLSANTWYWVRIEINAAGTSAELFLDDVSLGTYSTNLPLSGTFVRCRGQIWTVGGATSMVSTNLDLDYMRIFQRLTTRR